MLAPQLLVVLSALVSVSTATSSIQWNAPYVPVSTPLGSHWQIHWNDAHQTLHVSHDNRSIWESLPSQAFAGCGYVYNLFSQEIVDAQQYSGNFKLNDLWYIDSTVQTVDFVTFDGPELQIQGTFHLAQFPLLLTHLEVEYSMSFSVAVGGDNETFDDEGDAHFKMSLQILNASDILNYQSPGIARTWIQYASDPEEKFFGFGHQYSFMNLKGQIVPIITREQGNGRGLQPITFLENELMNYGGGSWDTTYAAIPQYVSSRSVGFFLENYDLSFFDLRQPDRVGVSVRALELTARLVSGETMLDVIEHYTEYSGRMKPLPEWITNGSVVGMELGRTFVEKTLAQLEEFNVPVSAFWLQDWVGLRTAPWGKALWWNWESDDQSYPDWKGFVNNMREKGVRVMNYVNPMFANVTGQKNVRRVQYDEVVNQGFSVRYQDGSLELVYVNATLLDLYNDNARVWMKDLIKDSVLGGGVSGYMCDFGEAYPLNAVHSSDAYNTGGAFHNAYPEEWAKLNREVADELSEEIVFFTRSAFTQSPKYTSLMWLGDQMVTWDEFDGIKSSVVALLNGGFSGFSLTHTDIGGYQALDEYGFSYKRSKELFLRWCELSAFSGAIFRTHPGSDPSLNWQFYSDNETLANYSIFSKMFVAWKDYRSQLMTEAWEKGYPLARHVALHYPEDPVAYDLQYQYLIGSEWMFAPVLDEGVNTVLVYLPEGEWVHIWSGSVFNGPGWQTCNAPLGQPCLFYVSGTSAGPEFIKTFNQMIQ
eukprot:TRINITY_DN32002_c0_g1_i1.p1 TRINITY_DN32002_c0_g1~~TRINITY_DN32002_c0_g1_i1.p1  ORF type:complete len:761 (+),score=182.35 TRINITY_DN32002_c0_g1_i1:349-2631(+)